MLFPSVGLGKAFENIEINRYSLMSFINTSADKGVREELQALQLVALQNRMVLDQLTAQQGGICKVIGETCCTYIPDNDADGHVIDQAIANMTKMEKNLRDHTSGDSSWFNFAWLSSLFGPTSAFIGKAFSILFVVCLLFGFIICCCIPCFRGDVIQKMISTSVAQQYVLLQKADSFPDEGILCDHHLKGDDDADTFHLVNLFENP
ncbi:hypothetical protein LDENG_00201420 [Lucifuga dentata]|nr:hypothetical protein LDENG_00201420 [Lucifuga dentata]